VALERFGGRGALALGLGGLALELGDALGDGLLFSGHRVTPGVHTGQTTVTSAVPRRTTTDGTPSQ
jgi:hypothetical protein